MKTMSFNKQVKVLLIIGILIMSISFLAESRSWSVRWVLAQLNADAPNISNVKVAKITPSSFLVNWETDRNADSMINFGRDRRYGITREPGTDKKEHDVLIDDLFPGTKYYFRIVSTDKDGNQGISSNYSITTEGSGRVEQIEKIESEEDRSKLEQIAKLIEGITEEEALALLSQEVQQAARGLSDELTIVGPPSVKAGINSALVTWKTNRPSDSNVQFAPENQYNEFSSNAYVFSQGGFGNLTIEHSVEIIGLEPFTLYNFRVVSKDKLGITGASKNFTFKTKALLPVVQNFILIKAEEDAATLGWNTTVPSSALLEYEDIATGEKFSKGSPTKTTEHVLRISDLKFGATYRATAVAESDGGETLRSESIEFTTVKDEEPPIISNVTNESTLFPGVETRVQTIISWLTDEPSVCILFYRQGLSPTIKPTEVPSIDDNPTEKHVRILVSFTPSTVYQYWVECADRSGNEEKSGNFVLFTPQQEKSIIDIILENFEGAFGWIKNIGG